MADLFFSIFLCTVLITRLFLYFFPVPSPTVGGFRMHHYMYGIAGIFAGLLVGSVALYAVGSGLFIDELAYLLLHGKSHKDNYSAGSLVGTCVFILVIFFLRHYIARPFI